MEDLSESNTSIILAWNFSFTFNPPKTNIQYLSSWFSNIIYQRWRDTKDDSNEDNLQMQHPLSFSENQQIDTPVEELIEKFE